MTHNYTIRTRDTWLGDPVVRSSSGAPRPPLATPYAYVTYHWTGVNVRWGDVGDTDNEIRSIDNWATSVGKPNEYNTVIHQDPDDIIHEYAGNYRAAHSAGENSISHGVLFLNGIHEPITERQIDKMRWLNQLLAYVGYRDDHTLDRGHRDMPGANTTCPGPTIHPVVPTLAQPHHPTPPTPPPTPPGPVVPVDPPDDPNSLGYYLVTHRRTVWGISAETYGTGTLWGRIADANLPDTTPNPGERWLVPGFTGTWHTVQPGDGPIRILDRIFGTDGWNHQTGVEQFWQWNGGDPAHGGRVFTAGGTPRALQPSERVWIRT